MFGPKTETVRGNRNKLQNKGFRIIVIISVINSWEMGWAGHEARTRDMRNADTILARKPEHKMTFADLGVDGRKILKRVLKKQIWECGLDPSGFMIESSAEYLWKW
jgi:hypothetical protein